jgi:hypothetical protein
MKQYRKITAKLYQCLASDISCGHKVPFGNKCYCTWLLGSDAGRTEGDFPCEKEGVTERDG